MVKSGLCEAYRNVSDTSQYLSDRSPGCSLIAPCFYRMGSLVVNFLQIGLRNTILGEGEGGGKGGEGELHNTLLYFELQND